jgi:hypothetical protein
MKNIFILWIKILCAMKIEKKLIISIIVVIIDFPQRG